MTQVEFAVNYPKVDRRIDSKINSLAANIYVEWILVVRVGTCYAI